MIATAPKITLRSAALHRVRVPLVEPFRISNGQIAEKEAILVELETTDGVVGWGEASPMSGSFYSTDTPDSAWDALASSLVPLALGTASIDPSRLWERLDEVPGEPFAKAGIEGAVWDASARAASVPLCELFGGRRRPIESGVAVGIYDTLDELLDRVARYVAEGYRRVKIKIEPGWDLEPVAAVRERFASTPLMVDANAAYTLEDASLFRELDGYDLMMFEQPLGRHAHEEAAELQRLVQTPICADESAESLDALDKVIALGSARIVNIKVQRVGGLANARRMLERARGAGLECWVGTMPELGVASAQGLQFASLDGFSFPTDLEASARWFVDDVVEPSIAIDLGGYLHLPPGPGNGYEVSPAKVAEYRIAHERFDR